jgi:CheY-like chemotaxis protein
LHVDKKTALVVDHDSTIKRIIGIQLSRLGFAVEFAGNGSEAVSKTSEREYALVVIEAYLPEMNGIEAVRRLRAEEASRQRARVPVVSTCADDEAGKRMLAAGASEFIIKPLLFERLDQLLCAGAGQLLESGKETRLKHA